MNNNTKQFFFNTIAWSLILVLVGGSLIKDGMFMDGMLYASVAHNLSLGLGSFWYPYFADVAMPFFHEQPPLTFGIQSLFYKILGSSMYTERIYGFLFTLINAFLIIRIWKTIQSDASDERRLYWLPVILWIIIPICHWTFSNNMEEVTMGVFVSLGILLILKSLKNQSAAGLLLAILGGLSMFCGFLCKGFPALFIISLPGFYWLFNRHVSFGRATLITAVVSGVAIITFLLLISITHIRESLFAYLNDRVFNSIANVSTGNDRFYIVRKLFIESSISIAVVALFVLTIFLIRKKYELPTRNVRMAMTFFCTGLAGTLPLMVTLEQRGFYFVTTLPLFAIGLGLLMSKELSDAISLWSPNKNILKIASMVLIAVGFTYVISQKGNVRRHKDILSDIYKIGQVIPGHSRIAINSPIWNDWSTQCYLVRYYNISCDPFDKELKYYLLFKDELDKPAIHMRHELSKKLSVYDLYLIP